MHILMQFCGMFLPACKNFGLACGTASDQTSPHLSSHAECGRALKEEKSHTHYHSSGDIYILLSVILFIICLCACSIRRVSMEERQDRYDSVSGAGNRTTQSITPLISESARPRGYPTGPVQSSGSTPEKSGDSSEGTSKSSAADELASVCAQQGAPSRRDAGGYSLDEEIREIEHELLIRDLVERHEDPQHFMRAVSAGVPSNEPESSSSSDAAEPAGSSRSSAT